MARYKLVGFLCQIYVRRGIPLLCYHDGRWLSSEDCEVSCTSLEGKTRIFIQIIQPKGSVRLVNYDYEIEIVIRTVTSGYGWNPSTIQAKRLEMGVC